MLGAALVAKLGRMGNRLRDHHSCMREEGELSLTPQPRHESWGLPVNRLLLHAPKFPVLHRRAAQSRAEGAERERAQPAAPGPAVAAQAAAGP